MKQEFKIIANLIEKNTRILDVGCGDGTLMEYLKNDKKIDIRGIEISKNNVQKCIGKGLTVIEGDAEKDLGQFPDESFDFVILSQTLQAFLNPITRTLPDEWYNTQNLHMCTIKDFFNFCKDRKINLYKSIALQNLKSSKINNSNIGLKNFSAALGIFLLEK